MKIGVVGMGWVRSSVAISTLQTGVATELLVQDLKADLAEGEALDLSHGASFYLLSDDQRPGRPRLRTWLTRMRW